MFERGQREFLQVARYFWQDALHGRVSRSDVPRVDASMISEMKDMAEENRRLKRMYAEMSSSRPIGTACLILA